MDIGFPLKWELADGTVLIVDIGRMEEAEEVGEFFKVHFMQKTPNAQLCGYPKKEETEEDKQTRLERRRKFLAQSLTLVVREGSSTGKIVAVWFNEIEEPKEAKEDEPPDRLIMAVLKEVVRGTPDLFALYETDKIFHLIALSVHKDYCMRGLATRLNKLSLQLAVRSGAGAAKAEAVSEYAFRSFTKLGFEVIKSVDYATFEFQGTTPLAGEHEMLSQHTAARLVARRLLPDEDFSPYF